MTLCHVCHGAHEVEATYACGTCRRVLCETALGLHASTGFHVVTEGSRSRICGRVVRLEVRTDMTVEPRGWRAVS